MKRRSFQRANRGHESSHSRPAPEGGPGDAAFVARAMAAPRWAQVGTLLVVMAVTIAFVWQWRFGYTCDHAISGLMAKSILRRGERPLFLWTLGYNGILLESYAVALCYWLFGHGPRVYYLFTLLCFWGLAAALYRHAARYLLPRAALLAVLFYVVSSPRVYYYVLRPQPNYTEIFLLGLIVLAVSQRLLRQLMLPVEEGDAKATGEPARVVLVAAALGLLVGFSLYTYQLILFFLGAQLLHGVALYFADAPARAALCPVRLLPVRMALQRLLWLGALILTAAPALFFAGEAGSQSTVLSRYAFFVGAGTTAFAAAAEFLLCRFQQVRRHLAAMVAFGGSVAIGYSPALYFKYVLHGFSRDRLRVSLSPDQVKHSFWLFVEAQRRFLNAWEGEVGCALGLIVAAAAVAASGQGLWRLWQAGRARRAVADALEVSPLLLLPLVTIPLFCFAAAAEDWESARWTIGLSLFFAFAQAWAWQRCWQVGPRQGRLASAVALAILLHNGSSLYGALRSPEAKAFHGEEVIAALKERHITRAYADYWLAYSIDLATDEEIIIEPLYNNYSPHYGPIVRQARRVAIVDHLSPRLAQVPDRLRLGDTMYRKVDLWLGQQAGFVVLERM